MNNRLLRFLEAENISQSQFADSIGVARASISHILSGRNKPGFDFIESTARHYPSLNIEWLITGNGRMYKDGSARLFDSQSDIELFPTEENGFSPTDNQQFDSRIQAQIACSRRISRITVFFEDGTFEEFK